MGKIKLLTFKDMLLIVNLKASRQLTVNCLEAFKLTISYMYVFE